MPAPAEPTTVRPPSTTSSDFLSSSTDLAGSGRLYAHAVARIGVQVADALEYAFETGNHSPRHQAVEYPARRVRNGLGYRLWPGQSDRPGGADPERRFSRHAAAYMPPERFRGQADRRGDVYTFGLTLYEMLALRPAFDEPDRARLIRQITDEEPPRLLRLDPSIPRDLATIVHKAMAREPAHRYATAGDLAADLRRFLDNRPIVARRPSLLDRAVKLASPSFGRHRRVDRLGRCACDFGRQPRLDRARSRRTLRADGTERDPSLARGRHVHAESEMARRTRGGEARRRLPRCRKQRPAPPPRRASIARM